jgi:hypothetical protein
MALFVIGYNLPPNGVYLCVFSKVLEKSSDYALACLQLALSTIDTRGADRLLLWGDTGPHYRSYLWLGSAGCQLVETHHTSVDISFGCEHHFKGRVDSCFAVVNFLKRQASLVQVLSTIDDLIFAIQARAAVAEAQDPLRPRLVAMKFDPTLSLKKNLKPWVLKPSCAPAGVQASYSWRFTLCDTRRPKVLGVGMNRYTCTAIQASCTLLTDCRGPHSFNFHPEILPNDEVVPGDGEDPTLPVVPIPASLVGGWRCSYRDHEPELESEDKVLARQEKKYEKYMLVRHQLGESSRHQPLAGRRARAAATAKSQQEADKRAAANLRESDALAAASAG